MEGNQLEGRETSFDVFIKDKRDQNIPGKVDVTFEYSNGQKSTVESTPGSNGQYGVKYTPQVAGRVYLWVSMVTNR